MRRRVLMDSILGGGDMNKYESIFIGNGTQEITIPLDFEPDYIYVKRIMHSLKIQLIQSNFIILLKKVI